MKIMHACQAAAVKITNFTATAEFDNSVCHTSTEVFALRKTPGQQRWLSVTLQAPPRESFLITHLSSPPTNQ